MLWPNGWAGPKKDWPNLALAISRVDRAFVPWINREGKPGGFWKMVAIRNVPDPHNRKSVLVLEVATPPGSHVGPLVHRPTLQKWGVKSAPAYRLTPSPCLPMERPPNRAREANIASRSRGEAQCDRSHYRRERKPRYRARRPPGKALVRCARRSDRQGNPKPRYGRIAAKPNPGRSRHDGVRRACV